MRTLGRVDRNVDEHLRWWRQVVQRGWRHGVMVVVAGRTWGSVADSVCSVGAVAFNQKVMSINCSSVGMRLA